MLTMVGMGLFLYLSVLARIGLRTLCRRAFLTGAGKAGGSRFQSGTRNDDRLYHAEEFPRVLDLRRQLAQLPVGEAIETLMKNLAATQNNTELLLRGLR